MPEHVPVKALFRKEQFAEGFIVRHSVAGSDDDRRGRGRIGILFLTGRA